MIGLYLKIDFRNWMNEREQGKPLYNYKNKKKKQKQNK